MASLPRAASPTSPRSSWPCTIRWRVSLRSDKLPDRLSEREHRLAGLRVIGAISARADQPLLDVRVELRRQHPHVWRAHDSIVIAGHGRERNAVCGQRTPAERWVGGEID